MTEADAASPDPGWPIPPEVASRIDEFLADCSPGRPPDEFWGRQFDLGLAWVSFPPGCGGMGGGPVDQLVVDAALRRAGVGDNWTRNPVGVGIVAPILVDFGTVAQRSRWLRPAFTTEEVWCQLFSEPEAGSDLASLTTRAEPDGAGGWVVHGRKIWTTLAHRARWGLLLARTGAAESRHRGLTVMVVDMASPGVTVKPIRMITGAAEFNEVTLDAVAVPAENQIGAVGRGWAVAMSVLSAERMSIGSRVPAQGEGPIAVVVDRWRASPRHDPLTRHRVVSAWVRAEAVRLTNLRARQNLARGVVGPEASLAKLTFARLNQTTSELALDLSGPAGLAHDSYEWHQPTEVGWTSEEVSKAFLRSRANSIEGGTSEILLTVIAERVLGLPPEPKLSDKYPSSVSDPTTSAGVTGVG